MCNEITLDHPISNGFRDFTLLRKHCNEILLSLFYSAMLYGITGNSGNSFKTLFCRKMAQHSFKRELFLKFHRLKMFELLKNATRRRMRSLFVKYEAIIYLNNISR